MLPVRLVVGRLLVHLRAASHGSARPGNVTLSGYERRVNLLNRASSSHQKTAAAARLVMLAEEACHHADESARTAPRSGGFSCGLPHLLVVLKCLCGNNRKGGSEPSSVLSHPVHA